MDDSSLRRRNLGSCECECAVGPIEPRNCRVAPVRSPADPWPRNLPDRNRRPEEGASGRLYQEDWKRPVTSVSIGRAILGSATLPPRMHLGSVRSPCRLVTGPGADIASPYRAVGCVRRDGGHPGEAAATAMGRCAGTAPAWRGARNSRQPLTEPPTIPRTKKRCRPKNTASGSAIEMNAAAARYHQPSPSELTRLATTTVNGSFWGLPAPR
jgi:hypothetical protein